MKDKFNATLVKPIKPGRLTLVTDGWINVRGESIINYMLVTPEGGAHFHSSETAGVNSHTGEFLAQRMMNVIEKVGVRHINAICCDSAANQQKEVQLVQEKLTRVFDIECISHQLNLVIKDILKLSPFAETMQCAVSLAKWFRNHHIVLKHLNEQPGKIGLETNELHKRSNNITKFFDAFPEAFRLDQGQQLPGFGIFGALFRHHDLDGINQDYRFKGLLAVGQSRDAIKIS
ncbi:uncharacterized protein CPUR_04102 [Claviceps purpurea 20.1]|uniref:DUF659 domain-containing protein n=1 Tax=Claviceps purpurea (strain 20.1) TaxID=1111077 RepID=M1WEP4_CLAP2|nr:uncharacterized protein CPUR_04102 [Claviceps purpurea 20.1]